MSSNTKSNFNCDFGYYNFTLFNNTDKSIPANFLEDRVIPVLQNCQDWQVACVRFKIPSSAIPLFKFEDDEYVIGIRNEAFPTASLLTETVVYNPAYVSTSRLDTTERFIWSYTQFLLMLNETLRLLWNQAIVNPNYIGPENTKPLDALTVSTPPYFKLDEGGSHLILVLPANIPPITDPINPADLAWTNFHPATGTLPGFGVSIFVSPKLQYLLSGFATRYDDVGLYFFNPAAPKLTHQLLVNLDPYKAVTLSPIVSINTGDVFIQERQYYIEWYQEYSCLYLWYALSRILLGTAMPIEQESVGALNTGGQPLTQRVLTDFEVVSDRTPALRDFIEYQPASDYRYTNFQTNGELRKIDLRLSYQDNSLNTYPINILPGSGINVKLQFKRRKARNLLQYSS